MKTYHDLMRRCQRGVAGSGRAIEEANNLLAECYAAIGALSTENQRIIPAPKMLADPHPLDLKP
jgi:hypothetical protein